MGYEFFESTASNEAANEREAQRIKASKERKVAYQEQKEVEHSNRLLERDNRKIEDWTVNQSALEFEKRINEIWGIKPWKLSGSKFYIAFASARKKFDTNGVIELEMMNLFFTQLKINKESDGEKLWKLFISRYSELATRANLTVASPDKMQKARETAEAQWKKEFGEDFSV